MPGEAAVRRSRGRVGQRTESSARCLPDVRNQDEPDSRKEIAGTKQPSHTGTGRHAVRTEPAHRGSHRTRRQAFQLLHTASHAGATLAPRPAPASGVLAQPAIWPSGHLVNRPFGHLVIWSSGRPVRDRVHGQLDAAQIPVLRRLSSTDPSTLLTCGPTHPRAPLRGDPIR